MPSYAIEVDGETVMLRDVSDEALVELYQRDDLGRYETKRVVSTMAERFIENTTGDDELINM